MTDNNSDFKVRPLLERLGYSFKEKTPAAYAFALNLKAAGMCQIRIVQLVTLTFPIEINF